MSTVDKFCVKAYTAVGGKLTVHDWQQVFDPAFGTVVAKSRCGRIVDRRVLIQVVTSQPLCKRCQQLSAAKAGAPPSGSKSYRRDGDRKRRRPTHSPTVNSDN